jgi:uncharacterized delta-60 repeat protein
VCIAAIVLALFASAALLSSPASVTRAQTQLDDFKPNVNGPVYALALQADGKLLVGGNFTAVNGQPRSYLARLTRDGTLDASFAPTLKGAVYALALQPDGQIIVGGDFKINETIVNWYLSLARFRPDGTHDTDFRPNMNDAVNALAIQPDGQMIIGGAFTTINATIIGPPPVRDERVRDRITRINPAAALDESFDPEIGDVVKTLALQPDGKILVGGRFSAIGGVDRGSLIRLNADGSLDSAFDPQVKYRVNTLALQADGNMIVGGEFMDIGTQMRCCLARINADGALDTTFAPNAGGDVTALAVQANGQIIVGGADFTSFGGQPRNRIARVNTDGSLDPAFDPNANGAVNALLIQPDGKILVGGAFTSIGGQPRNHLARLNNTTAAQQQLTVSQDGTTITWKRSGAGPELSRVVFEQVRESVTATSALSATATLLGEGVRTADGWQLSGLKLPRDQAFVIRARGFYGTGSVLEAEQRVTARTGVYLPLVRR